MCGIAFLLDPYASADDRTGRMRTALTRLAHRGPDDTGCVAADDWTCGHRRLSIIDLAGSRQPMCSPDGRYVLSYNGEIYNYRAVRARLASHWTFRTEGDTELLLAGLCLEGAGILDHLDGMWAFAFWDGVTRRLLLARDRFGEKPLYYRASSAGFACASELAALRALCPDDWQEDHRSTADYLRFGYCLPGTTIYRHVHEVLPGHTLEWRPLHTPESTAYWLAPAPVSDIRADQARERLREALTQAVASRLTADVEVGAFLSGGIDSSLIVALLGQALGVRPKTFSIGFTEHGFDERRYARLVAARYGTDHHEAVLHSCSPDELGQLILRHVGQPFADSSLLPTAQVAQLAARHVRVSLSGDGADELFGGYQRYLARTLMRWYLALPSRWRCRAEKLIRGMPEPLTHHSRSLLKKAHLFLDVAARAAAETPYVAPMLYDTRQFAELAPGLAGLGQPPPLAPFEPGDDLGVMLRRDALVYLPQDILAKVDRATMAHSLEARAPYLARPVAELALSLPADRHHRRFTGKRLLRETFTTMLPARIWHRRKQGFAVPVHQWFREGALAAHLTERLATASGPLSAPAVEQLLAEHRSGKRDHGYRLWNLYVYLMWLQAEPAG